MIKNMIVIIIIIIIIIIIAKGLNPGLDSEDDNRAGCWDISHCQQKQSSSELRSAGRSYST